MHESWRQHLIRRSLRKCCLCFFQGLLLLKGRRGAAAINLGLRSKPRQCWLPAVQHQIHEKFDGTLQGACIDSLLRLRRRADSPWNEIEQVWPAAFIT